MCVCVCVCVSSIQYRLQQTEGGGRGAGRTFPIAPRNEQFYLLFVSFLLFFSLDTPKLSKKDGKVKDVWKRRVRARDQFWFLILAGGSCERESRDEINV